MLIEVNARELALLIILILTIKTVGKGIRITLACILILTHFKKFSSREQ